MLRLYLLCLAFFVNWLGEWVGESFGYFVGNGVRYWRLIVGLSGVFKELKTPCGGRGFDE